MPDFAGVFGGMGTGDGCSCFGFWGVWGLYLHIGGVGGGPWHAYTPPPPGVGTRGIRGQIGAFSGQIDPQNPPLT